MELGRVSSRSVVAQEANRMLDKIRVGVNQAYQKIVDRGNYVTAEKVRRAYLWLGMNHGLLLAVYLSNYSRKPSPDGAQSLLRSRAILRK